MTLGRRRAATLPAPFSAGSGAGPCAHDRPDEGFRRFRIECIAITAQASHSGGSPMSQRECCGFNWPPLSIAAVEPISIPPEAVSRAGPQIAAACARSCGCADARSAEIDRPAGVTRSFQVSLYKVEPSEAVAARNLLAKDDERAALADEPVEGGPKVPLVSKPAALACRAERLAWAGSGPDQPVVGPSGSPKSVGPDADAGEEMMLAVTGELARFDIAYVSLVHVAGRNHAGCDQLPQPGGGERIVLVVVSGRRSSQILARYSRSAC
jgi:hypothetical protein